MFGDFAQNAEAVEREGVYVGGWSFRDALTPKMTGGKHGEPFQSQLRYHDYGVSDKRE
jgi:hypothetical protein